MQCKHNVHTMQHKQYTYSVQHSAYTMQFTEIHAMNIHNATHTHCNKHKIQCIQNGHIVHTVQCTHSAM